MLEEISCIFIRAILMILVLFVMTKVLGKKQISNLTIYDYIVGITMGSIAADALLQTEKSVLNGCIALFTFGLFGYGLSFIALKNSDANTLINGEPIVLMKQGHFLMDNLKKTKITISKFIEQARLKGYYDISVLHYAILETNGEISFLPKEEYQSCNPYDLKREMKSKKAKQTMCTPLLIDGEIKNETLHALGKTEEWFSDQIRKSNVTDYKSIVLATMDEKENVHLFTE